MRLALIGSGMVAFLFNYGDELSPIFVSAPVRQVRVPPVTVKLTGLAMPG